MKKYFSSLVWLSLAIASAYYGYKTFNGLLTHTENSKLIIDGIVFVFVCGFSLSAMIYNFMYKTTSNSLNMYKRELEKESVNKAESTSRVKVLESKIEVLEKALEEALKK